MSDRDGLGWEFTDPRGEGVCAVFREDRGPFPVFSSARGPGHLPPRSDLEPMTRAAVADLLEAAGLADSVGWITDNIAAALLFASMEFLSWEGEEWALESGENDAAIAWADKSEPRTPYAWLRATGIADQVVVGVYQDDAVFGPSFLPHRPEPELTASQTGSIRPRHDIALIRGCVNQVEAVFDTVVDGRAPGPACSAKCFCTVTPPRRF